MWTFLSGVIVGIWLVLLFLEWPNTKKKKPISKKTWNDDNQNWPEATYRV
jgi:hypothetical protein